MRKLENERMKKKQKKMRAAGFEPTRSMTIGA